MAKKIHDYNIRGIAAVGSYVPRQCGIATFTNDVVQSITTTFPRCNVIAVPVNDIAEGYAYGPEVRFEIQQDEVDSYRRAADFLNIQNIDVVSLQHEFGIYGGMAGSHVLALIRELRMPVVTTLHTVLKDPDRYQRKVMDELAEQCERLVVMSHKGVEFLREIYGVPEEKIAFIHHGIPETPFVDPSFYKDKFRVEGRKVLLTFGLLSPNKGLEYGIRAMAEVVEKHPDAVYMIVGATHPGIVAREGEQYRHSLEMLAEELGIRDNIVFHNRFVELEELVEFIGASDVYLTPYLNEEQITSGTLAYAVGSGKAVVSTKYWHAEELLAEERGRLVPFRDAHAIATEVIDLLDNDVERNAIRKRAFLFGRDMIWPVVASDYLQTFHAAREARQSANPGPPRGIAPSTPALPTVNLTHLERATDSVGLLGDAHYNVPRYTGGYHTRDNAQAVMAAVMLEEGAEKNRRKAFELAIRYLAFLEHAWDPDARSFQRHLSFERVWTDRECCPQTHGIALWALGVVLGRSRNDGLRNVAGSMFHDGLEVARNFVDLRACAFTLIGIQEYLRRFAGDRQVQTSREGIAQLISEGFTRHATADWPWCEPELRFANATIPHALLMSGQWTGNSSWVEQALKALDWLGQQQMDAAGQIFAPIGDEQPVQRGEDGNLPRFPQRPQEAYSSCSAYLEAWRVTGDSHWKKLADRSFDWFLGRNDLRSALYDPATGGCREALEPGRINPNQSPRATLVFLLSLLEMRSGQEIIVAPREELTALEDRERAGGRLAEPVAASAARNAGDGS